jgi:hypothetical protein
MKTSPRYKPPRPQWCATQPGWLCRRQLAAILLYSAVNQFFRDHQRQPIAVGELLADARRGLEMLQRRPVPADSRLPLAAPSPSTSY